MHALHHTISSLTMQDETVGDRQTDSDCVTSKGCRTRRLQMTGKRPTNSGMRPYPMRSLASTSLSTLPGMTFSPVAWRFLHGTM